MVSRLHHPCVPSSSLAKTPTFVAMGVPPSSALSLMESPVIYFQLVYDAPRRAHSSSDSRAHLDIFLLSDSLPPLTGQSTCTWGTWSNRRSSQHTELRHCMGKRRSRRSSSTDPARCRWNNRRIRFGGRSSSREGTEPRAVYVRRRIRVHKIVRRLGWAMLSRPNIFI